LGFQVAVGAEEVGSVERRERSARAQLIVRDIAVVEAYRDQPGAIRAPPAQLLDAQQEFLVLVTLLPGRTVTGEAGDEHPSAVVSASLQHVAPSLY
jgi:hypothetical protein